MSQDPHIIVEDHTNDAPKKSNSIVRGAIIVAIILVLLFIALAIVKFVPKLISSFGTASVSLSSLFSPKENITVSAPSEVKSGSPFTVSWKNNVTEPAGSLMWSYQCADNVTVEYTSTGGQRPVICNTLFPLPATGNSYSFVAKNSGTASVPVTMTVALYDADMKTVKVQGSTNMTVLAPGSTATVVSQYNPDYSATTTPSTNNNSTNTNTNGTTKTTTKTTTNNTNYNTGVTNGTPDLSVSLVKVGRTQNDGSYISTNSFAENDRVTVIFKVTNTGTARSGTWSLRADLPTKTQSDKVYVSNAQPALNPGDSYQMTISFDAFDPNGRNIIITISNNDYNQSNNVLNIPVTSNGNNSNNDNNNSTGSRPDLTVRIIDVGTMGNNNQFYYSNSLNSNDKIAVKFEIQNIGGSNSGSFRFTADLPTSDNNTFESSNQSSLAPGETRQYTLGFDNPDTGTNTITIDVDSDNDIRENNENNNDDSMRVRINN
ncbi:MAG: CARDB domain-containing protein [Patescibacteria group bacterium]